MYESLKVISACIYCMDIILPTYVGSNWRSPLGGISGRGENKVESCRHIKSPNQKVRKPGIMLSLTDLG